MKKEIKGSITVFLSLIMLMIVSIIMTTLEAARINGSKTITERTMLAAMDSVLAEYYLPLFHEYHLFSLDGGFSTGTYDGDMILANVMDYMDYTFKPNKDMPIDIDYFDVYGIETTDINLREVTNLTDYEGKLFMKQATEHMQYVFVAEGVEKLLESFSFLGNVEVSKTIMKEKQKMEEDIVELEEEILKLMQKIDGISSTKRGIKVNKNNNMVITGSFVKKICPFPINMSNTKINNEWVFSSLYEHYVDPIVLVENLLGNLDDLLENLYLIEEAEIDYQFLSLMDTSKMSEEELEVHSNKLDEAEAAVDQYKHREKVLLEVIKKEAKSVDSIVMATLETIKDTYKTLDKVIEKQNEAQHSLVGYESFLKDKESTMDKDIFDGILEDFLSYEKYKIKEDNGVRESQYISMKETLAFNQQILESIHTKLSLSLECTEDSIYNYIYNVIEMKSEFSQYSFDQLNFDYSSMKAPIDSEGFMKGIREFIDNGVMSIVIDDVSTLSKKEVAKNGLPSDLVNIESRPDNKDITTSIGGGNLLSASSSITNTLDSFEDMTGYLSLLEGAMNDVGETILFQEYLKDHFNNYTSENPKELDRVLNYELEYILVGRNGDFDNISSVVMRLILFRTMMNLITILGDKQITSEARMLAISLVGFTGMPIIISIVKFLIIVILSIVESLIDVVALLKKREVPLKKPRGGILIKPLELFTLSKSLIHSKASQLSEATKKGSINYNSYLTMFLYVEKNKNKYYRAMDIIQENIRLKYDDSFYIKNCIHGFAIDGEFTLGTKFINLSYIRQLIKNSSKGYRIKLSKEYSY